jgi:hypothetical protein
VFFAGTIATLVAAANQARERRETHLALPFPIAMVGAPLLGSLVFTLTTVDQVGRRAWLASGIAFRLGIALAMAGAWGSQARDEGRRYEHFSFGWTIGAGVLILFLVLVGVMIGVALARLLRRRNA